MTGIRSSFVFCRERTFRAGKNENDAWIAPPAGSFLSTTHSRTTQKLFSAGSKYYDTVAYGQLSGSWEWTFTLDYDYIEPLFFVFEGASYDDKTKTYTFEKSNALKVPSFTIRRKILNDLTNGFAGKVKDETIEYYGCVVKTCRLSKAGSTSQISVTLNGFYATEQTVLSNLPSTDYQEYNGELVEFACLFAGDIANDNYVANTESITLGIENSAAAIIPTCTPFATDYCEGQTSLTFGTTCYSDDPNRYKLRMYGGGQRVTGTTVKPLAKRMKPIPMMKVISYTSELDDSGFNNIASVYANSDKSACMTLTDVTIKSLTYQKGDGSKLQDQINSTEFRKFSLAIKNHLGLDEDTIWSKANPHSLGYVPPAEEGEAGETQE